MWSHVILLPHAQIGGTKNDPSQTLEKKLQSLLGAVESHWPSFEPNFSRVSNRLAGAMQAAHGVSAPMDASHGVMKSSTQILSEMPSIATRPQYGDSIQGSPNRESSNSKTKYIDRNQIGMRRSVEIPKMRPSFTSDGARGGTGGGGGGDRNGGDRSGGGW